MGRAGLCRSRRAGLCWCSGPCSNIRPTVSIWSKGSHSSSRFEAECIVGIRTVRKFRWIVCCKMNYPSPGNIACTLHQPDCSFLDRSGIGSPQRRLFQCMSRRTDLPKLSSRFGCRFRLRSAESGMGSASGLVRETVKAKEMDNMVLTPVGSGMAGCMESGLAV